MKNYFKDKIESIEKRIADEVFTGEKRPTGWKSWYTQMFDTWRHEEEHWCITWRSEWEHRVKNYRGLLKWIWTDCEHTERGKEEEEKQKKRINNKIKLI